MALYGITIFLSAFLLFQVELVIAKFILPWFGGTPAVWTTCMLFFQALLLGGYAYSHGVVSRLSPRRQGRLHLLLLAASLALAAGQALAWGVPLLPGRWWSPAGSDMPVLRILALLAVGVGLPFFLLSATSSLLQAWFARARPGRSPYRLYALSNAGSLLGLVSYPFVVEPLLGLKRQATVWSAGYVAFAVLCGLVAWRTAKARHAPAAPLPPLGGPRADDAPPGRATRALWLALTACASVLLLATTNQISEEIAVVPFLWVLPLSLYLISFIVCFNSPRLYVRWVFVAAAYACIVLVGRTLLKSVEDVGAAEQIGVFCAALLVCCMLCHGELVRLKPSPRHLTGFYLHVAAGGALGGVFAALVAPYAFNGLWELYLGYFVCGACVLAAGLRDGRSLLNRRSRWVWRGQAGAVLVLLAVGPLFVLHERLGPAAEAAVRRVADGLGILRYLGADEGEKTLLVRRNFYGIFRVTEADRDDPDSYRHTLYHAQTIHGYQYRDPELLLYPASYYSEESGIAKAILYHPRRQAGEPMRVGVVGLGTGTLAAWGRAGDVYRFYEINPAIVRLSAGPDGPFTFLHESPAATDVVLGDARISLARQELQQFDILALDAFSGDAIPVHLLTREAFEVYLRHLRGGGVLAVHISNRYFELEPVVWKLAEAFGLDGVTIHSPGEAPGALSASWMLLTWDSMFLEDPDIIDGAWLREDCTGWEKAPLWTDDYSNLLGALRTGGDEDE